MHPNFFKCLLNCECYVLCYTSSCLFTSLGSLGAIIITQGAQCSPYYKIWNHSISMHTERYWHQSFWNYGLFSSTAELSGFLAYQLHTKGTVLCFWSCLRCIKIWIVIYNKGLKFPHKAVVLLVLDSDAACNILIDHSARKSAVMVLVWCPKPEAVENKICECTDVLRLH